MEKKLRSTKWQTGALCFTKLDYSSERWEHRNETDSRRCSACKATVARSYSGSSHKATATLWFIKKWRYICDHNSKKILIDFNNFCISGNGNECPLQVSYLVMYFTCVVNMTSLSHSCWWAATASAACVARLGAVTDWWRSWSVVNMLACLCSCQWWTFSTYLVTVNLLSLYLMNFVSRHAWCSG